MKITPSVAKLLKGFPKKEHDIDTITGTSECMALNLLINDLWENAASMATLKGGGKFGHTALCMSPTDYATIPRSVLFLMTTAPGGELTFTTGAMAVAQEDTKLM